MSSIGWQSKTVSIHVHLRDNGKVLKVYLVLTQFHMRTPIRIQTNNTQNSKALSDCSSSNIVKQNDENSRIYSSKQYIKALQVIQVVLYVHYEFDKLQNSVQFVV